MFKVEVPVKKRVERCFNSTFYLILILPVFFIILTLADAQEKSRFSLSAHVSKSGILTPSNTLLEIPFTVGSNEKIIFEVITAVSDLQINIQNPDGQTITPENVESFNGEFVQYTLDDEPSFLPSPFLTPGTHYVFILKNPVVGVHIIKIEGSAFQGSQELVIVTAISDSQIGTALLTQDVDNAINNDIVMTALVFEGEQPVKGASIEVKVVDSDVDSSFVPKTITLLDNGAERDFASNDGIYTGVLKISQSGEFLARAVITGITSDGNDFERRSSTRFFVRNPLASFTGAFFDTGIDDNNNGLIDKILITPRVDVIEDGTYDLSVVIEATNGNSVYSHTLSDLFSGINDVDVAFGLEDLKILGINGPYFIKRFSIENLSGDRPVLADEIFDVGQTKAFEIEDFGSGDPTPTATPTPDEGISTVEDFKIVFEETLRLHKSAINNIPKGFAKFRSNYSETIGLLTEGMELVTILHAGLVRLNDTRQISDNAFGIISDILECLGETDSRSISAFGEGVKLIGSEIVLKNIVNSLSTGDVFNCVDTGDCSDNLIDTIVVCQRIGLVTEPSPVITPTPTLFPTPTLIPTPIITPTPTALQSPSPSFTPSPTPTSTPILAPTPTPTEPDVIVPTHKDGLTIVNGHKFNANTGTLNITGSIANSGTLQLSTGLINIGGNWTNSGVFIAGTGNVTINSSTQSQSVITGGTSSGFNTLVITNSHASGVVFNDTLHCKILDAAPGVKKLSFANIGIHTILTDFNVNGSKGNLISVAPLDQGKSWNLDAPSTSVNFLNVSGSHEADGKLITAFDSIDSGNNKNWEFVGTGRVSLSTK